MSIGHEIARALTEHFYLWELRGRGWGVWPTTVRLEPPFRPFVGHFLPRQLSEDDGRVESIGSRLAGKLGLLLGFGSPDSAAPPSPEEVLEPDAICAPPILDDLVELQIALPPDYSPQASVFEQFLFSVGYASAPIAFEVIGWQEELVVQIAAHGGDAEMIRQQLRAFFPEGFIVTGDCHLRRMFEREHGQIEIMDFGLEREFMVPINNLKSLAIDPLVAICGALDRLEEGEAGVFQVLLEPTRLPWAPSIMRAVSLGEGKPFFSNDPELLGQARLKVSRPLYAVVVRVAASSAERHRTMELIKTLAGALRPLSHPQGNQLLPLLEDGYDSEHHFSDLLGRRSRRSGMILNSDELIALIHLPTAAVRAKSLRRVLRRTKAVPTAFMGRDGVFIGTNEHEGVISDVRLPDQIRLNHFELLGATGSGKSTLLALMARQDIVEGRGVAVIDPHGDLIDVLIPHVPAGRMKDVILFDPTDEEYAIAFNPLSAASDREKDLLATDFIAVMKQHTSGWGDQMSSLLGNAVLAFLSSTKGGTLPELRRFLADPSFRTEFLKTVANSEVLYFWEQEAGFANKSAVGSILTRLDSLLRYQSLLHILGQRANKLDFADIMDSGKIFLARLAKGLIGGENAYILGGLLVSRFYQTTIARQAVSREHRRPFFLLLDEAGDLLTSTVGEILKGTRKYGLGLTLAHQTLGQLRKDEEIYGAVTGNCGIKVCFQVGGDDARKMAEEFGGFVATDLMNQAPLSALARVGPRDDSFNLRTQFLPEAPRPLAEAYAEILSQTRARYSTPRSDIRAEISELRQFISKAKAEDPFSKLAARQKKEREAGEPVSSADAQTGVVEGADGSPEATSLGAGPAGEQSASVRLGQAASSALQVSPAREAMVSDDSTPRVKASGESIKNEIIQTAGGWGYSHETEKPVNNGTGRVDIVLSLGSLVIAVEISVTTGAEHEFERSVRKCLQAGFRRIILVCDAPRRRNAIQARIKSECTVEEQSRIECLTLRQLQAKLGEMASEGRKGVEAVQSAVGKTVFPFAESLSPTPVDRQTAAEVAWKRIQSNKSRDRGNQGMEVG